MAQKATPEVFKITPIHQPQAQTPDGETLAATLRKRPFQRMKKAI